MDIHSKTQRSYNMSRIKSSKTEPELRMKILLKQFNFVYHPKGIYGKPDFANKKIRTAIFMDGCFWHVCPKHYIKPTSNTAYWKNKAKENRTRDRVVNKTLRSTGWTVIRIWEHQLATPIESSHWYKNLDANLMVNKQ